MTGHLLIFGLGYTSGRLASQLSGAGWRITATRRSAVKGCVAHGDRLAVAAALATATHILSSVPPDSTGADPVLTDYGADIAAAPARWRGYLSSTGVYGDTGGAWVDESAAIGHGRRSARAAADLAWQQLRPDSYVFRLPGIYGPGRSAIDRVRAGDAHRIDAPGHLFSRIHVDDIVRCITASFTRGRAGVYNLADATPATGAQVIEYACDLLGQPYPPLEPVDTPRLSAMARGFYTENRRIAASKLNRELAVVLHYPDFRHGLRACL